MSLFYLWEQGCLDSTHLVRDFMFSFSELDKVTINEDQALAMTMLRVDKMPEFMNDFFLFFIF